MRYTDNGAEDIKIAYIGGGSRGWGMGAYERPGGCTGYERQCIPV